MLGLNGRPSAGGPPPQCSMHVKGGAAGSIACLKSSERIKREERERRRESKRAPQWPSSMLLYTCQSPLRVASFFTWGGVFGVSFFFGFFFELPRSAPEGKDAATLD